METTKDMISIVLVNWNTREALRNCILHIPGAVGDLEYEVIVVDNDSSDRSVDMVRREFPWVSCIRLKKNIGYACGVNMGIRCARGAYIMLLNPDVIPRPGSIATMVSYFRAHHEIGVLGGSLFGLDGQSHMEQYNVPFPSLLSALIDHSSISRLARWLDKESICFCDYSIRQVPGACLLASREVVDAVGAFDEDFFVWFEDLDWCVRARKKGFGLSVCPRAIFVHEGGRSFHGLSHWTRKRWFHRNLLRYFKKHQGTFRWIVLAGVLAGEQSLLLLADCVRAVYPPWRARRIKKAKQRASYVRFLCVGGPEAFFEERFAENHK